MVCQVPGGAASRATKQELAGSYDDAFASYITAAQGYLFLLRHTADAGTRDRMRTLSNKLVERAERIKQAKKIDPQIRATNALAIEAQDAVLAGGSKINGLRLERWTSQHERGSTITVKLKTLAADDRFHRQSFPKYSTRQAVPG
ncbi:cysteine protease [Rhodotorula sphaerocarpa]